MVGIQDKVVVITGASRGIGREIALMCAKNGAKAVVISAKTADPHPKLKGTIHTVAEEARQFGCEAVPFQLDVRDEERIQEMMKLIEEKYGRIDILINNASAISPTPTEQTTMKKYHLMQQVNAGGTFGVSKFAIPLLLKSEDPQILNMSPPLDLNSPYLKQMVAYSISKFGMSLCTLGMSREFEGRIRVNSLWPLTTIATAAIVVNFPPEFLKTSLSPQIVADAAKELFTNPKLAKTGQFWIDHEVLKQSGGDYDFDQYKYKETPKPEEFLV